MELLCSCGGGDGAYHPLGKGGCFRMKAEEKLIPTNFRKERLVPAIHKEPIDVCDVNGYSISVYTLKCQRLYAQHPNGDWSLPKDESSINSLEGGW